MDLEFLLLLWASPESSDSSRLVARHLGASFALCACFGASWVLSRATGSSGAFSGIPGSESASENLIDFLLAGVHDILDAADVSRLVRQGREVVAADVFNGEFAGSGHELAQSLAKAFVVGVQPERKALENLVFEREPAGYGQRQVAARHVAANGLVAFVPDGPGIDDALGRAKDIFDHPQLLVFERRIFCAQFSAGAQHPFAVVARFLFSLGVVNLETRFAGALEIFAVSYMPSPRP